MPPPKPSRESQLTRLPVGDRGSFPSSQRFLTLVRDALLHLHDLPYLQTHPLTRSIPLGQIERALGPGRALRQSLLEAVESLRPARDASPESHPWQSYELLRERYVEARPTRDVQGKLGISRSKYHRDHRAALDGLAVILRAQWGLEDETALGERPDGATTLHMLAVPERDESRGEPRHNLPSARSRFVGRGREMAEVRGLLETTRLLTLTGTGGCGKTRIAIELARGLVEEYDDGVWLVALAGLADPTLVPQAVATALSIREEAGTPLLSTLVRQLMGRRMLLLLDNCEHLLDACARLADSLLEACPDLAILATSRQSIGIDGETVWRVPSLPIPAPEPSFDSLADCDSVRLFVDRARSAAPAFSLSERSAPAVVEICRRLDGIPLAIELAAARARVLSPEQIASHLERDFHLLTGGSRSALPRHQTLEATLDWSHDLLSDQERVLLRRLSVFAGGFSLEAAEAVCSGEVIEEIEVIDLVSQLVDKSLVEAETGEKDARYRLLEPVRQYARHRLEEASEAEAVGRKHVDWFYEFVRMQREDNYGRTEAQWLEKVARERDNVRAALQWCLDRDPETGLALAGQISRYWQFHGEDAERDRWLFELLDRARGRTQARADALLYLGIEARDRGDSDRAAEMLEESLAIDRELGDDYGASCAVSHLGNVAAQRGEHDRARMLLEEGVAAARRSGSVMRILQADYMLGGAAWLAGDYQRSRELAEEALPHFREAGAIHGIGNALSVLGKVACSEGDYPRARSLLEESLGVLQVIDDRPTLGMDHTTLGYVDLLERDYVRAREHFAEALRVLRPFGHRPRMSRALCLLGILASREGDARRASRLVGSAEALNSYYRHMLPPNEQADLDACLASARTALGEEAYDRARAEGQSLSPTEAIDYALETA